MRQTTRLDALKVIPQTPGVYLLYSEKGHLLYVGKSVSLRARIYSHIIAAKNSNKEERLMRQAVYVEWEETAGELGALLLEAALIKQYQPVYNQRLRKSRILYGLKIHKTAHHYNSIELVRLSHISQEDIHLFYGLARSKRQLMQKIIEYTKKWNLCAKLTLLEKGGGPCFYYQIKRCKGACLAIENSSNYNQRMLEAFDQLRIASWPYGSSIIVKEMSCVTAKIDYHKIDRWCHLASEKSIGQLTKKIIHPTSFDFDIYKILAKCILTPSSNILVIKNS